MATNGEIPVWIGIDFVDAVLLEDAMPYLARADARDPRWAETVLRLPAAGLLPDDAPLLERLAESMRLVRRQS